MPADPTDPLLPETGLAGAPGPGQTGDPAGATGFEQVQVLRDPGIGLLGFLVIHDTRLGPAFGGIRLADYASPAAALADAMRLAEHMTLKCAIQDVPGGGGKLVLVRQPGMDRGAVYRRVGERVAALGGRYFTGPDVGTGPDDLLAVGERTRYVALPDEPKDLAGATAAGVFAGIRSVGRRLGHTGLGGLHVVVAGLGAVGGRLAGFLAEAGARLTVADPVAGRVAAAVERWGATPVEPERAHAVPCDVFAPCALGGVVNRATLEELSCRAIAGCANNVLESPACGTELHRRRILYAPDYVINSGGLVHGALFHLDGRVPDRTRIERIGELLDAIFAESAAEDLPPEVVADRTARGKLARRLDPEAVDD